eukprot:3522344-Rhodomonas_salina.2
MTGFTSESDDSAHWPRCARKSTDLVRPHTLQLTDLEDAVGVGADDGAAHRVEDLRGQRDVLLWARLVLCKLLG